VLFGLFVFCLFFGIGWGITLLLRKLANPEFRESAGNAAAEGERLLGEWESNKVARSKEKEHVHRNDEHD
jgi:hypothetical protein